MEHAEKHHDNEVEDSTKESKDGVSVTVRTPSGASHGFEFNTKDKVNKVVRETVKHFVSTGELAAGEYGLAVVRDGAALPMNDGGRLDDYGIADGDVLHLTNKGPQVDG